MTEAHKGRRQTPALVVKLPGINLVGSAAVVALLGVIVIALAYWRKIRLEEERLRAAFGVDYDAYRRKSRALIPGLL
jgi:protein-S-isoprenylcysteine O-methyltransferase Ste14